MLILGLNPNNHDPSACLVRDGVVIAAVEEERFTRVKHGRHQLPWHASLYCLAQGGVSLGEVDYVAVSWAVPNQEPNSVHFVTPAEMAKYDSYYRGTLFPDVFFGRHPLPRIVHVTHHLSHAASSFRCSGFMEAAVLVVDAQGEHVSTSMGVARNGRIDFSRQYEIEDSLGYFYQCVSLVLGFGAFGEGKMMGLAGYGVPRFDFSEIKITADGYVTEVPRAAGAREPDQVMLTYRQNTMARTTGYWLNRFQKRFGSPYEHPRRYLNESGRLSESPEYGQVQRDIAASAQAKLEEVILHLSKLALRASGTNNLVLSGGVALNCSANGKIVRDTGANVFVFPAAGDGGGAVGAALETAAALGDTAPVAFRDPFSGPEFTPDAIEATLREISAPYHVTDDPAAAASKLVGQGQTIGWFQGRAELGPRALGHRSILANPTREEMTRHVNNRVKHREWWRPLAPSITAEAAPAFLDGVTQSPFMLLAVRASARGRAEIPATVHVDGTTRPQTVDEEINPLYHQLLKECERTTGNPVVLNTSFNDETEPMVCTPRDALKTFWSTGLDALVIGPFVVGPKAGGRRSSL
jgi:carbamoyltransferase